MNHPSEWARFFDENTGRYRYKHKGSGIIRDTFMTIGKIFKKNRKDVAKKTTEKAGQKVGKLAVEKGSKQIRKILQELNKQRQLSQDAYILQNQIPKKSDTVEKGSKQIRKILQERKKQKPLSQDAKKKLANILQNQVPKKSDALVKLNQILANEI